MSTSDETSFPLYDHIYNALVKNDQIDAEVSIQELSEIVEAVRRMDKNGLDCIFVIIRIHSLRNEDIKVFDVPYKGEKVNKRDDNNCDVKFDIRLFPTSLKRILLEFVRIHAGSAQK